MAVDFDAFVDWAKSRFDDVKVQGKEVKINSIFTDDSKFHLWCCPKKNSFHCWKTDKGGTLPYLVTIVEGCSYGEACQKIGMNGGSLRELESKLDELFGNKVEAKKPENRVEFPEATFKISSLSSTNHYRLWAEKYILNRKLNVGNLLVCIGGKYKDRIIIPYYGREGELIYWNGRDLTGKSYKRYDCPEKDKVGYGKDDVLWMSRWPGDGTRLYLTEGEFDAMSLNEAGIHGAACGGKNVGPKQVELLRPYKVTIAFDTDKSGAEALNKISKTFEEGGITDTKFVRPPKQFKDWNEMLTKVGKKLINAYIKHNETPIDTWKSNELKLFCQDRTI